MQVKNEIDQAAALYARLKEIKDTAVPVVCRERSIPRKEQAALARKLFKQLGLKGISVTVPNYSMAHVVEVRIPRQTTFAADFQHGGVDYSNHSYSDMPEDVPARIKSRAKHAAELAVAEILARAFPQHDDRSDSMTDYFDSKWSID